MKRLYLTISLLLAAVLTAVFLGACGGAASDSADVTLTILGKESDLNKPYLTRLFQLYQDSTGNQLKLISYEDAEFETKAALDMAEGRVPDILLHFHNADLNRYDVARDFCMLEDQAWSASLTDSARAYCTDSDGHLLGLPFWESSVSGCYYNKTLLTQLGLLACRRLHLDASVRSGSGVCRRSGCAGAAEQRGDRLRRHPRRGGDGPVGAVRGGERLVWWHLQHNRLE